MVPAVMPKYNVFASDSKSRAYVLAPATDRQFATFLCVYCSSKEDMELEACPILTQFPCSHMFECPFGRFESISWVRLFRGYMLCFYFFRAPKGTPHFVASDFTRRTEIWELTVCSPALRNESCTGSNDPRAAALDRGPSCSLLGAQGNVDPM